MSERLFHLATPEAWRRARAEGRLAPPSLASEGFVHLSFAHQLAGTLAAHFAGVDALVLLELDRARVADALRLEPSRGGALFPHLYRALDVADVIAEHAITRGADGAFALPAAVG